MPTSLPSPLGDYEVHDLVSKAVGDTFRLFVAERGEEPRHTLIIADGNILFGLAVQTVQLMQLVGLVPPMVIVGVGYPGASTADDTMQIRARDLTPSPMPNVFELSGRSDDFVAFIADELQPWLSTSHQIAAEHLTYFGHSLGGLFGTHVLLSQPELFDQYIVSSPSLWWGFGELFRIERRTDRDDLAARVYAGIGGLETDEGRRREAANLAVGHPFKPVASELDMVADLERFVTQLRERHYPSLDLTCAVFPDEFHATVPGVVLTRGLRHFFGGAANRNG